MRAGDRVTVDFHLDLPELVSSFFSFSPAIADGTLQAYTMCDWIDNAITLQMGHGEAQIYGYLHLPCRVEVNARLQDGSYRSRFRSAQPMSIEFTGERVVPGQVDADLWNEHLARYAFADRFADGLRVLDAGCGRATARRNLAQTPRRVSSASTWPRTRQLCAWRTSVATV